jgi:hypothetical protein
MNRPSRHAVVLGDLLISMEPLGRFRDNRGHAMNDDPPATGREKHPNKSRLPWLLLSSGNPTTPTFRPLTYADPLYALAAWSYHHADALDPSVRWGLFEALAHAWPVRGRPKTRKNATFFVTLLLQACVSTQLIAKRFGFSRKYVNELARASTDMIEAMRDPERMRYRIECEARKPNGLAEPPDPAHVVGLLWMTEPEHTGVNTAPNFLNVADSIAQELGYEDLIELQAARATATLGDSHLRANRQPGE